MGVPIIAITGGRTRRSARVAAVVLDGSVAEEACPHDLAPTASTTVALALGDALPWRCWRTRDSAARTSPRFIRAAASAGELLLRVRDVMLPPGACFGRTPRCATPS